MVLAVGVVLLLWCVRDFYSAGRGTLAPWSPPEHLVVIGLYRWSRNPMYIAVLLVLWGWALGYQSPSLGAYALAMMIAFHLRVVLGEEPWLARHHGLQWSQYQATVPRWFGPL
jgi:protein-S-isoprenylcysteine O-methyltransferase Ste14